MHFFTGVLVPFYTDWGGIRLSQVLFLNAWFMFWNFVLEVPTGTVADFLGRKVSLALGSVVGILAAYVYVSQPSFVVFLIAEIIFATAYTLHSGADEALAFDSLKAAGDVSSAKRVFSRMESCKLAGIIVAAIVGGFIASRFGLSAPMLAYVVPAGVAFLIALTLKEPVQEGPVVRVPYRTILFEGGKYFLKHKVLLVLTLDLALTNAFAWAIIWVFQPLLERAGMAITYYGSVQAAACVGQILLLSNVERIEKWLGSKRAFLTMGALVAGAAFVGLGVIQSLPVVVVLIVVAFTFGLPRVPVFSAYLNKYVPSDKRATVLSMTSMCRTFGIVIINPITGLLADWSLSGTMGVLGAALIVLPLISRVEETHLA